MIRISYVLMGLLLLCVACNSQPEKETPNGFKYKVIKAGEGNAPKAGELLVFNFQLRDNKDSVWNESYKQGYPAIIEIRDTSELKSEDGITQMLRQLSPGDSVKASMKTSEFFKKVARSPVPPTVDSTGTMTYYIKCNEVLTKDEFPAWRDKKTAEREKIINAKDEQKIKKYLGDNKLQAQRDTSGIYYIVHNSTGSEKPTADKCVEVKYEGKLLEDGRIFDKNEKIAFSLMQVIRGWQISIPMLAKGDSGTFYIPSKLAYGPQGYPGAIPPDAVLIFKVQLLDFKNEVDPVTRTCK
jgi:FKBP-type peptidyl-prolyl cis-trans isomerase FkpA